MKYETLREQAPDEIVGVTPYFTEERDADPVGVYQVEPVHTELTELYDRLDPVVNDDFDKRVHGVNAAYAALIQHHFKHFDNLLNLLDAVVDYMGSGDMEVTSRSIDGKEFFDEMKKVVTAAKKAQCKL